MGSKQNPGAFDCYSRAEPDEPMFVLLGRDPSASLMIEIWTALRREMNPNDDKLDEALACAEACLSWAHKKGKAAMVHAMAVAWDGILGAATSNDRLNFDLAIGRLDHVLSQLIGFAKDKNRIDADKQTLKHHAEDMIMAGEKILRELAPTYTCVHCGAASPKDEWGPGRITCPKCKKVAPSAAESERAA
jgi:hypothetical protein